MLRKIGMGALIVPLVLILTGCAGSTPPPISTPDQPSPPAIAPDQSSPSVPEPVQPSNPKPSGPIKAAWIEPQLNGDTVSILTSEVHDNWNTHFSLETEDGDLNFMAYILDGIIHVRANVCPPCKSIGYSIVEDILLVCDRCATTFEAKTGEGIKGACVDYPKAPVSYEITDGQLEMNEAALIAAYQDTLKPGWP